MRALPVWLAAAAGAQLLVHASAGSALPAQPEGAPFAAPGPAVLRDHLNFSGSTPLLGLGESKLGPALPRPLAPAPRRPARRGAGARGALGIPLAEAIAACTLGPALETPAERRMLARLGADVSVPNLATPLLAAGHAGLAVLAIVP
jgi:purine-nucleoside phosphorylase